MRARNRRLRFEVVVGPYSRRRRGYRCSFVAIEGVESGVEGLWRHVGARGDGEEGSGRVEGRSRVACLKASSAALNKMGRSVLEVLRQVRSNGERFWVGLVVV